MGGGRFSNTRARAPYLPPIEICNILPLPTPEPDFSFLHNLCTDFKWFETLVSFPHHPLGDFVSDSGFSIFMTFSRYGPPVMMNASFDIELTITCMCLFCCTLHSISCLVIKDKTELLIFFGHSSLYLTRTIVIQSHANAQAHTNPHYLNARLQEEYSI